MWLANQITLKYWLVLKLNNTLWLVSPNPIKWSSRDMDSRESITFFSFIGVRPTWILVNPYTSSFHWFMRTNHFVWPARLSLTLPRGSKESWASTRLLLTSSHSSLWLRIDPFAFLAWTSSYFTVLHSCCSFDFVLYCWLLACFVDLIHVLDKWL